MRDIYMLAKVIDTIVKHILEVFIVSCSKTEIQYLMNQFNILLARMTMTSLLYVPISCRCVTFVDFEYYIGLFSSRTIT